MLRGRKANILNVPSSNSGWDSLDQFLIAVSNGDPIYEPYSRNLLVMATGKPPLPLHLSVNKHGRTSQGYITAPTGTWLNRLVDKFLDKDFTFEYLVGPNQDVLIVPKSTIDISTERHRDEETILSNARSFLNRRHYNPPPNASEVGLYFELEEVNLLKKQGFRPSHRSPFLDSRIESLRRNRISCDIDLLDDKDNFIKYVEVKAVAKAPGNPFNLTKNEWQSRDRCRKNGQSYEIVVYYHAGRTILERQV